MSTQFAVLLNRFKLPSHYPWKCKDRNTFLRGWGFKYFLLCILSTKQLFINNSQLIIGVLYFDQLLPLFCISETMKESL